MTSSMRLFLIVRFDGFARMAVENRICPECQEKEGKVRCDLNDGVCVVNGVHGFTPYCPI